ncbi:hypothetical protein [Chryseosolibacter indicus]|uniref:Uncharacterized protein n=1 Tax=Chryseosolibacter indicus TaxID=2782351 RepID=A0ABS5VKS4_9BACT|nr:hypothetical protein [Chryseosolibacter indicus]MBT1701696.1 hypothetical protein [Chryseosolibacter indicus]
MRRIFIAIMLTLVFYSVDAAPRIRVPYCSDCMYITKVADLPDSASFYSKEYNAYADLGYVYKQLWFVWLPIWNYEGQYALIIKDKDVYFDISEDELKELAETHKIALPSNPVGLWDKLGGKAIIILAIALGIWAYVDKKNPAENSEVAVDKGEAV